MTDQLATQPGGGPSAQPIAAGSTGVLAWSEGRDRLADERFYWLATAGREGQPHVRPVLAVLLEDRLYSTSSPRAAKATHLGRLGRCAVSARTPGLDLVVEGQAAQVVDPATLARVAEAYRSKYGWPVTVHGGAFDAPYGAPTAGPPPYAVYEVTPSVVYGFGTDDELAPLSTRWRF